jgi:hypothetical protein
MACSGGKCIKTAKAAANPKLMGEGDVGRGPGQQAAKKSGHNPRGVHPAEVNKRIK